MTTSRWILAIAMVSALGVTQVRAAELGDSAKPLQIAKWVKGGEVDLSAGKGKHIYVVEFWATWCGPCRASIPHLTEMQAKYKDKGVVFVGISREELSQVKPFVAEQGDKMNYTVAVDDDDATSGAYMKAFDVNYIPHAFIIDRNGKVAWHGSPSAGLEKNLELIVSGKYDVQALKQAFAAREELLPKFRDLATKPKFPKKSNEIGDRLVTEGAADASLMHEFAKLILTDKAIVKPNYELAARAAKIAYDECNGQDADMVATYAVALAKSGQQAEAAKLQKKALDLCAKDEALRKEIDAILTGAETKK